MRGAKIIFSMIVFFVITSSAYGFTGIEGVYKIRLVTPIEGSEILSENNYKLNFVANPTTSGALQSEGNYKVSLNIYKGGVGGALNEDTYKIYLVPEQAFFSYTCDITANDPLCDTDNDGVLDINDLCPNTPSGETVDADGCSDTQKDSDDDGIPDYLDACPIEDSTGFDADVDGCIDTLIALQQIIDTLPDEVLSDEIKTSLVSKVENALKSVDKEKDNAAINMLNAFINEVEAQKGKKISEEVADMLIVYANNIIVQIQAG